MGVHTRDSAVWKLWLCLGVYVSNQDVWKISPTYMKYMDCISYQITITSLTAFILTWNFCLHPFMPLCWPLMFLIFTILFNRLNFVDKKLFFFLFQGLTPFVFKPHCFWWSFPVLSFYTFAAFCVSMKVLHLASNQSVCLLVFCALPNTVLPQTRSDSLPIPIQR